MKFSAPPLRSLRLSGECSEPNIHRRDAEFAETAQRKLKLGHYSAEEKEDAMDQWLEEFKQTIEEAAPRLVQITEAESERPRAEEQWSCKQVIGHLIDSAANNHARFVVGQMKDDLVFAGYDQDRWVQIQHYQEAPWLQLVDLWRAYNLHLLHVMTWAAADKLHHHYTQHSLETIAFKTVSETEPATLGYLMKDYVVHLKHHLGQIFGESA